MYSNILLSICIKTLPLAITITKQGKKKLNNARKFIAITLGDPEGIGPEIIFKSLQKYSPAYPTVIIGSKGFLPPGNMTPIANIEEVKEGGVFFYNIPLSPKNQGDTSFNYVKKAVEWAMEKKVQAVVTGPISKEKWQKAGISFNGHTEYLAKSAGVKNHSMFFWSKNMKVALFTVHIPLKDIFSYFQEERIIHFMKFLNFQLRKMFSIEFTFLVSGLNPHAGEGGFLGQEEIEIIAPAIARLKSEMRIEGPLPPDAIFLKARDIKNSVVISWYHDQGLIPFKLLNIHDGVNLTLGLPFIRTSPDHGTAFDIAGKNIANPSSMEQAIRLADHLIQNS